MRRVLTVGVPLGFEPGIKWPQCERRTKWVRSALIVMVRGVVSTAPVQVKRVTQALVHRAKNRVLGVKVLELANRAEVRAKGDLKKTEK